MDLRIQGGYVGGFGMQGLNPMERPKPIVNPGASTQVQAGKKVSPAQCQTCATRMYKDGSDENDVSFKAPGHIDPGASAAEGAARSGEITVVSVTAGIGRGSGKRRRRRWDRGRCRGWPGRRSWGRLGGGNHRIPGIAAIVAIVFIANTT